VIRLLWDFYGPNAEPTAAHHRKHLAEFLERNAIDGLPLLERDEGRVSVLLELPRDLAEQVGRVLRPNRALLGSSSI
jgi:hypothetical protein